MPDPGGSRRRIAQTLSTAYGASLISDDTFTARLDQTLTSRVVDRLALVGDLNLRHPSRSWTRFRSAIGGWRRIVGECVRDDARSPVFLALDWTGEQSELLLGRHHACDVVLVDPSVSRRHARLVFRDHRWIVQDLHSTNGTIVNGTPVGRCELRPGDVLVLGDERLTID